jgi:hypothetical protein
MADDKKQTLDIPNGTTFEFKDGKLIFGHESDICIRTNMGGYKFQKIFSKRGNVQVLPPDGVEFDVDEIEAPNGDVFLNGRVRARVVRGRTVHFQEGQLAADLVEAQAEVVLSGARLNVLHVKAPRVVVDPDADGMLLVVESQNEIGRTRARGGFRSAADARGALEQFARLTGGASGLPPAAAPVVVAAPAASVAPAAAAPAPGAAAAKADDTQELRAQAAAAEASVLPKSSVFRKRS